MVVKKGNVLTAALLLACSFNMCTISMGAAIPKIQEDFQSTTLSVIQMSMNFAGICAAMVSMCQSWIQSKFNRRFIILNGLGMFLIAGIGAMISHDNIVWLFLWTGIMGIGTGLIYPLVSRIITEDCPEEKRGGILALQNAMNSSGGVVMSLLGGVLVARWWPACYGVNLLAFPVLILCIIVLPKQREQVHSTAVKGPVNWKFILKYFIPVFCFAMVFFIANSNISVLVAEENIGNAAISGAGSAALMLGGMAAGVSYERFYRFFKKYISTFGIFLAGSGLLIMSHSNVPMSLWIGAFLTGSSFSFVSPFYLDIVTRKADMHTMGTALGVVGTCSGAAASFLSPVLFTGAGSLIGISSAAKRMKVGVIICVVLALINIIRNAAKEK